MVIRNLFSIKNDTKIRRVKSVSMWKMFFKIFLINNVAGSCHATNKSFAVCLLMKTERALAIAFNFSPILARFGRRKPPRWRSGARVQTEYVIMKNKCCHDMDTLQCARPSQKPSKNRWHISWFIQHGSVRIDFCPIFHVEILKRKHAVVFFCHWLGVLFYYENDEVI